MELVLEVTSDERHLLGDNARKSFRAVGGIIGRHSDCDWVIPDQKRHLSGRHAVVSCEEDGFHISDVSTNGVFINGDDKPLGGDRSYLLSDADRLSMGNMEFIVRLQLDATHHPFVSQSRPHSQPLKQHSLMTGNEGFVDPIALFKQTNGVSLASSPEEPENISPLAKEEQVVSAPDHRSAAHSAFSPPNMLPEDWLVEAQPQPQPQPQNTRLDSQEQKLLERFFKGLGVSSSILAKVDGGQAMEEMGACLRENMSGMMSVMQQRAHLKNEFRMDMTLVQSQGNNPLKFSADKKQALKHLFRPQQDSFLSMSDAFKECYEDLQMHQVAMLSGTQASLRQMFKALSPEFIEQKVDNDRAGISISSKPSRCWHQYRCRHEELSSEDDAYNQVFSDAFVRAYDAQMELLKSTSEGEK